MRYSAEELAVTSSTSTTICQNPNCDCRQANDESSKPSVVPSSNRLAYEQSLGFFDDIPDDVWKDFYQFRARNAIHNFHRKKPLRDWREPAIFYLKNYEPTFTCPQVCRVGGLGDGPKWTCDPHQLPRIAAEGRRDSGATETSLTCLVYSIGSAGRFLWEDGCAVKLVTFVRFIYLIPTTTGCPPWRSTIHFFIPGDSN